MKYPHREDVLQGYVDHLPNGPYAHTDAPHLYAARYSMTGFEKRDVEQKIAVDSHGALDNTYWYNKTREENRSGRA